MSFARPLMIPSGAAPAIHESKSAQRCTGYGVRCEESIPFARMEWKSVVPVPAPPSALPDSGESRADARWAGTSCGFAFSRASPNALSKARWDASVSSGLPEDMMLVRVGGVRSCAVVLVVGEGGETKEA
jgi:hypothetical protein